jgi:hypothetical protein
MPETKVIADPGFRLDAVVRRYLDLPKFLDFVHSRSLYFCRADCFADRLEGALFPDFRAAHDQAYTNGQVPESSDDFYLKGRTGSFVSCWSVGAKDNMALWQLYGGAKTSIVVTTTVRQLLHLATCWNEPVELRRVQYVDHRRVKTYVIGKYNDFLRFKNEAYSFENEARLLVTRLGDGWKHNPRGLRMPIEDLNAFVRSVVLPPEAEPWFCEAARALCAKFGLSCPVNSATLSKLPT